MPEIGPLRQKMVQKPFQEKMFHVEHFFSRPFKYAEGKLQVSWRARFSALGLSLMRLFGVFRKMFHVEHFFKP